MNPLAATAAPSAVPAEPPRMQRGRGRPPRHDRRRLLDLAAEVLLEHGLHALTHASLARRAGVATASVQHHFRTAAALRHEALEHRALTELDELHTDLAAVSDAWDQVVLLIRNTISDEPQRQRAAWTLWLEYYGAATRDAVIAQQVQATRMVWRDALIRIIDRGQLEGTLRPSRSAETCASMLFALIDGFGMRLAAPGPADSAEHIIAMVESLAADLLRPRP
jgi:AcrR family transcriptional regulator